VIRCTECFKHVRAASPAGYQPPRGGPKLYFTAGDARDALNPTKETT